MPRRSSITLRGAGRPCPYSARIALDVAPPSRAVSAGRARGRFPGARRPWPSGCGRAAVCRAGATSFAGARPAGGAACPRGARLPRAAGQRRHDVRLLLWLAVAAGRQPQRGCRSPVVRPTQIEIDPGAVATSCWTSRSTRRFAASRRWCSPTATTRRSRRRSPAVSDVRVVWGGDADRRPHPALARSPPHASELTFPDRFSLRRDPRRTPTRHSASKRGAARRAVLQRRLLVRPDGLLLAAAGRLGGGGRGSPARTRDVL